MKMLSRIAPNDVSEHHDGERCWVALSSRRKANLSRLCYPSCVKGADMQPFRVQPLGRGAVTAVCGVLTLAAGLMSVRLDAQSAGSPTFAKDIAPIFQAKC